MGAEQPTERAPSIPWNRNPLFYIRDLIASDPKFTPRARSHALLNLETIKRMVGEDQRQQAMAAAACYSYGKWTRLVTESAQAKSDTGRSALRDLEASRAIDHYAKCVRMAGLTAKGLKRSKGRTRASMFTAPAESTPNDQRAGTNPPLAANA